MIEATIDGTKILLKNVPYRDKDTVKTIHGCRAKYTTVAPKKFIGWNVPLTMDTCFTLRRVFGRELLVGNDLTAWAREALNNQASMEQVRSGEAISLDRVAEMTPQMFQAMSAREYQKVGSSFIYLGKNVILGDDPGLGKTIQTLAALVQQGATRLLVCCPKTTARSVWCNETNFWTPDIMPFVAQGTHAQREQVIRAFEEMPYDGPRMLIINTEMIRAKKHWQCPDGTVWDEEPGQFGRKWIGKSCQLLDHKKDDHKKFVSYTWPELFANGWHAIVMDESHQFLASTANIQSKRITQGRLGAIHLRRRLVTDGLAVALSGTPFRSDLRKAWGTLNWLRPDVFTSFHGWAQSHFDYEEEDPSKPSYGTPEYKQEPRDPAKFNAQLRPYYLGRSKADAAPDLPPVQFMGTRPLDNRVDGLQAIWLELTPEQRKAYNQLSDKAEIDLPGGKLIVNGTLAEITRKRQIASAYGRMEGREFVPTLPSNKIEWLLEFLEEHKGHDTKVVVASEFTEMCNLAQATVIHELGLNTLAINGSITGKKRDEAVARFQDPQDASRVMFLNMQAGGVGITLDTADYMILLDVPWKSDIEKQVVDRIHRVSRVHSCFVYRVLSLDTVDNWMGALTDEQRRILMSSSPKAIELARQAA